MNEKLRVLAIRRLVKRFDELYPQALDGDTDIPFSGDTCDLREDGWYSFNYEIGGIDKRLTYYFKDGVIEEEIANKLNNNQVMKLIKEYGYLMYDLNTVLRLGSSEEKEELNKQLQELLLKIENNI